LAKSVIEVVPIYPMMSSKIPKACIDDIPKIQRNFIWGDTDQKRRFHAVGWDKVTMPKWNGGLGLRKLETMNQACLLKLKWKYHSSNNDLWCNVLRGKYEDSRAQRNAATRNTDSPLWKNLVALTSKLEQHSVRSVRDGASVDAWNHAWIEAGVQITKVVDIPTHLQGFKVKDLTDQD
jgi:hypothetical protein